MSNDTVSPGLPMHMALEDDGTLRDDVLNGLREANRRGMLSSPSDVWIKTLDRLLAEHNTAVEAGREILDGPLHEGGGYTNDQIDAMWKLAKCGQLIVPGAAMLLTLERVLGELRRERDNALTTAKDIADAQEIRINEWKDKADAWKTAWEGAEARANEWKATLEAREDDWKAAAKAAGARADEAVRHSADAVIHSGELVLQVEELKKTVLAREASLADLETQRASWKALATARERALVDAGELVAVESNRAGVAEARARALEMAPDRVANVQLLLAVDRFLGEYVSEAGSVLGSALSPDFGRIVKEVWDARGKVERPIPFVPRTRLHAATSFPELVEERAEWEDRARRAEARATDLEEQLADEKTRARTLGDEIIALRGPTRLHVEGLGPVTVIPTEPAPPPEEEEEAPDSGPISSFVKSMAEAERGWESDRAAGVSEDDANRRANERAAEAVDQAQRAIGARKVAGPPPVPDPPAGPAVAEASAKEASYTGYARVGDAKPVYPPPWWTEVKKPFADLHRGEPSWSLFLVGRREKSWGFWDRKTGKFTPWREFISALRDPEAFKEVGIFFDANEAEDMP